jgi:glycosyltransferase involved in cell wall biosynthesis
MRILIHSRAFPPDVGGLETVMEMLAEGFVREGHEVKVVTATPEVGSGRFAFGVVRNPGCREFLSLVAWSEVVLQGGLSLKWLWPLLFNRRRLVVSHHTWFPGDLRGQMKNLLTYLFTNIAVSKALACRIKGRTAVIPNSYRNDVFREIAGHKRDQELVYLGRLVPEKGLDVLLEALARLIREDLQPCLTVIGTGPEGDRLRTRAVELGIHSQVKFVGVQQGEDLARTLNSHRILVIPSTWEEPFGIVALEAIGCGCVVIGTDGGGLPEAIGPCGVIVPRRDAEALATAIRELVINEQLQRRYRAAFHDHLARYTPERLVRAYLNVLEGRDVADRSGDDQPSRMPHEGIREKIDSAATPQRGECSLNTRRSH